MLCVLGLGSNKPFNGFSREVLVRSAAAELAAFLENVRVSPLYETRPLHITDQSPFVNAAVLCLYASDAVCPVKAARTLLTKIQALESKYGRDRPRERRWGERSLDIDILLFGDEIINEPDLIIPHPRLKERAFALRPLLDLLPEAADPETSAAYKEILNRLPDQGIRRL